MRPVVIVPYAPGRLVRATKLWALTHRARLIPMLDDYDYWTHMMAYWCGGGPFIVVEQDVIPLAGVVNRMWRCPEAWCGAPTLLKGGRQVALGCTKLWPAMLPVNPLAPDPLPWWAVDGHISRDLRELELVPHWHRPAAVHLHAEQRRRVR